MQKYLRLPAVLEQKQCSPSTHYAEIADGLMTPGIRMGARYVVWPAEEIATIIAARVRNADDDAIRALVRELVEARKVAA